MIISTSQHVWPVITYWPGKVHGVVEIAGDPRILILDGLTPFGVECRVSVRSGMVVVIQRVGCVMV